MDHLEDFKDKETIDGSIKRVLPGGRGDGNESANGERVIREDADYEPFSYLGLSRGEMR